MPQIIEGEKFFTTAEAADRMGYTQRHVTQLLNTGKLKGQKRGRNGTWVILESEVVRFMGTDDANGLIVENPKCAWYSYETHSAFYATLEVRSLSRVAKNCWAELVIKKPTDRAFILNWAGKEYTTNESEPVYIDITPTVTSRLDVAFAVPQQQRAAVPDGIASGQVVTMFFGDDPDEKHDRLSYREGCWIAQPLAQHSPDVKLKSYLSPGKYRVSVRIYRDRDKLAFSGDYTLTSPLKPEELTLIRTGNQVP